jgi:hypothetical protein
MLHFCLDCYGIGLVDGQRFDDRRSDVNPLEQSLLLLPLQRTTSPTSSKDLDPRNGRQQ